MSAEPMLAVDVRKKYPDFALDVRVELALDGITGLFGPSGSGKTTFLRALAGLTPAAGRISFGGQTWLDSAAGVCLPPWRRPVGYVFQDARLFSHLPVAGNLDYAAQRSRNGSIDRHEVVTALDLGELMSRSIDGLSGGERQRVAIGRALLSQPRLLLLDEPLAALDVARKRDIMPYIESLPARFGIPAVYVSHSIDEMARLASTVVLLDDGKRAAAGEATGVLNDLEWQLHGATAAPLTILEVTVIEQRPEQHLTRVDCHGSSITVPALPGREAGDRLRLFVDAGDVALALQRPTGLSVRNVIEGTLAALDPVPGTGFVVASVDIGGALLKSQVTRDAVHELALESGTPVFALLKTASFERGRF